MIVDWQRLQEAQAAGDTKDFVSKALRAASDGDKLEWLRDIATSDACSDKQLVLTALRWAMEFAPARIDALEHELLTGVFALVEELHNQETIHPAVKGLAVKVLADTLRAFGEHASQDSEYVEGAVRILRNLMAQLAARVSTSSVTPVDELLLHHALDLGDSLAKHNLISGQATVELLHVAITLQAAAAAGQFTKKVNVFELTFLFAFHCARSPREICPTPTSVDQSTLMNCVRQCCDQILAGTLHHVFPRCIAALLAFNAWCASGPNSPAMVEHSTDDEDHTLVYVTEPHDRQAIEGPRAALAMLIESIQASPAMSVSQKQKTQALMECLRAVLVACHPTDVTSMMDTLVSLLGELMDRMKASLKVRPKDKDDAADYEPKAQRKAAGDVRRECIECARVSLGSVHAQWVLSHEDTLFEMSTAQLSSPLVLVGACKTLKNFQGMQADGDSESKAGDDEQAAAAEAIINRCVDHLSRAMAKIDKYSAPAAMDVLAAVQHMAELGLQQMFTIDKHQTLRLVVYCYCMRTGAEMKVTALECLHACLEACSSLRLETPTEEARAFIESFALRILNDAMMLHRRTFISSQQALEHSTQLQVEGLQAHEHTVDVLCSLMACIGAFTKFLMCISLPKDESTGLTLLGAAPLKQYAKEHTIENLIQLESFLREALGVAPTFEDDFQLLQMEAEILVNVTLLLFGSMQSYTRRITDTAQAIVRHATTIRANPSVDHQCVFSVYRDEHRRLLHVMGELGWLNEDKLEQLRAEFPPSTN